ncbi:hypothetical protein [Anabaena sp. UHCC 0187]|uniref:hypothetical protein n=1 Tax=Anabaena sp. UHCC 0187 TaxID=2590018 RepID=UPI001447E1BF|nr:hypothetical protein [Anabaena sp. UHCC 0187]
MQLIDVNLQELVEIYTGEFYASSEPEDTYTLEDLVWILEQLSQHLELCNAV